MKWGRATETKVMAALRARPSAMTSDEVAHRAGCDPKEIARLMESMYWSSKLEKRHGKPPIYRIPGESDGKLSLPN